MKPFRPHLSTTQIIALGFLCAILLGTIFLTLPCSSASGTVTSPADALFTATTSVCVTGLVTVPTYLHWSLFGKVVILILIQLGGLGIISFTTGIMMVIGRKITLKDRILLEDALNAMALYSSPGMACSGDAGTPSSTPSPLSAMRELTSWGTIAWGITSPIPG